MKEFNLSERRLIDHLEREDYLTAFYLERDVKEFIKKLKEELCSDKVYCGDYDGYSCEEVKKIDKLAGKELINSQSDIKQLNEGERANE